MHLVRDFTCGACGAPRTTTDDAMFIACEFCGAMFEATTQRWFDAASLGEMFAQGHAMAFWASAASERFHALGAALEQQPSDGPAYRALAQEYHYVYAMVYPDRVPSPPVAKARAAWAARAAAASAAMRFDPVISPLFSQARDTYRAFGDRRASAESMALAVRLAVEATARAYAALQIHPELAGDYRLPPAHYARMDVRTSFATMLGTFEDPTVYERVATEVFGDRDRAACTRCGAPLEVGPETHACAHCGAVIEQFSDDPWVRAKLAMFSAAHLDLHRSAGIDEYVAALGVFACVGSFEQAGVERVADLIARAIPWLSAAELHKAAALYRVTVPTPAAREIFDAALASLEPWIPDPTRRPVPPSVPVAAFDAAAWLAKSRRYFGQTLHGHPVVNAFGIAIADLLASSPAARPPITTELVLEFFELVLSDIPRSQWLASIAPLVAGYADTPAGPLVRALADALT